MWTIFETRLAKNTNHFSTTQSYRKITTYRKNKTSQQIFISVDKTSCMDSGRQLIMSTSHVVYQLPFTVELSAITSQISFVNMI